MYRTPAIALLLSCSIATGPTLATELVLTAPRNPSAGQASTLVFNAPAFGYDLNPATQPVASIAGTGIRIDLNAILKKPS